MNAKATSPCSPTNFSKDFNKEQDAHLSFSQSAIDFLSQCSFPGNIRELENYVLRSATLARGDVIGDKDISCLSDTYLSPVPSNASPGLRGKSSNFTPMPIAPNARAIAPSSANAPNANSPPPVLCPGAENCTMIEIDNRSPREKIIDAMEQTGWVKAKAARVLGLTPRQIGYALEKYDVPIKKF